MRPAQAPMSLGQSHLDFEASLARTRRAAFASRSMSDDFGFRRLFFDDGFGAVLHHI